LQRETAGGVEAKKLLKKSIDVWGRAKVKRLSAQNVILQFKN